MLILLLTVFLPAVWLQDLQDLQDPQDLQDLDPQAPDPQAPCPGGSCYPPLGDLMLGRASQLSASSTCGLNGPQKYCILGYLEDDQKCFTCDSRLPFSRHGNQNSHRIDNVITTFNPDWKTKWWQSENGVHSVSIRLDLETLFQFSHMVLTFKSFRPAAMLVERSKDFGRTWKVFRYFSEDCSLHFPSASNQPAANIHSVVCDQRYSGPEPSTDGEVVLKALDPIFNIENPYDPQIQDLITLTNLRVNFTRLLTLGDTLLRRRRNPEDKYYYAVYNMVVRGSCFCHGHATRCTPSGGERGDVFTDTGMVHGRCVCERHTAGENCERCADFHHDTPWRPGGGANACRKCNCHGHSDSCHFDAARFEASGGASGGVCDDCRHDRAGAQCERCRDFLFLDPQRDPRDPHACIPCDCDVSGSVDSLCDSLTGRCRCRENVSGRRCDQCRAGSYRLGGPGGAGGPGGCTPCGCHSLGSLGSCDQETGSCQCHQLATGALCDTCVAGFWGLGDSGRPCSPCDCDVGGAYSAACSPADGQCRCLPNMEGRRCSEPAPLHFLPALDYFLYEAELAAPLPGGRSPPHPHPHPHHPHPHPHHPTAPPPHPHHPPTAPPHPHHPHHPPPPPHPPYPHPHPPTAPPHPHHPDHPHHPHPPPPPPPATAPPSSSLLNPECERFFGAEGFDLKFSDGRVVLVRRSRSAAGRRRRRRQDRISLDPGQTLQLVPRQRTPLDPVTWTGLGLVRVQEGAGLRFTVDDLPAAVDYQLVVRYETQAGSDWSASVSVQTPPTDGCDPTGSRSLLLPGDSRAAVLDSALCLGAGLPLFVDVVFRKQEETETNHILVDSIGLVPSVRSLSGFCSEDLDSFRRLRCVGLAAEPGPRGPMPPVCEQIIKSMSARIHNGAVRCRCDAIGSLGPSCSKVGGVCDCKPNVIGRCCDGCAPMSFGFGPEGCRPCDCDPQGSVSDLCDQVRGQCACRPGVTGRRCDLCQRGFWEFPSCRPCECNGRSEECEQRTGECRNCRDRTAGPRCDRCEDGYHGNPCIPCLCPDVQGSGRFFASSCVYDPQSLSVTCVCREGHTGPRCDRCGPGFHGDLSSPDARCSPCSCSGNVDPADPHACDPVTGECQRCLHHTTGPQCEACRPGYHGNALEHTCTECRCDRRGTAVTSCPLDSPCVCDPRTGQCPCRSRVTGVHCDLCEDGFWNLDGGSGCQSCSCDSTNSLSNTCNKVTGQCPCRSEFGGRQCDECGDNHFGDPDIQCLSCDCNLEGTERPSCDSDSGECRCRLGVSGMFCDRCAPGHDSAFPACAPCHPCAAVWTRDVTDVQRAAQTMRSLLRRHGDGTQPRYQRQRQRLLDLESQLKNLQELNLNAPRVEQLEERWTAIRKVKDSMDMNRIRIDPSQILVTEVENIRLDFTKMLQRLKQKVYEDPDQEDQEDLEDLEDLEELLDQTQKFRESFLEAERRLGNATAALEDSMDTRQEVKHRLDSRQEVSRRSGALAPLESKVLQLRVVELNTKVCGGPGLEDCSGCGGALCGLDLGNRKCGGPDCDGSLPVSRRTSETAEKSEDRLKTLESGLQESRNKVQDARQAAEETRVQAQDLQDQIQTNVDSLRRERDRTKDLIQRVRDFLLDETVPPEDIQKMSQAVLDIRLPRSADHIQLLIDEINDLLSSNNRSTEDLEDLEDQNQTVQDLVQDLVQDARDTKSLVSEAVSSDVYAAEESQDRANEDLDSASRDKDSALHHVQQMKTKLDDVETKLTSLRPEDLQDQIQSLKTKTDQNRETTRDARQTAESALNQTSETKPGLDQVLRLLEVLQQQKESVAARRGSGQRLKDIEDEVRVLKEQLEDKVLRIQGLETKIRELVQNKLEKARKVSGLLETVNELRKNISKKAEDYNACPA